MPVAAFFFSHTYGPGLMAAVGDVVLAASADLTAEARMVAADVTAPTAYADMHSGKEMGAVGVIVPTASAVLSGTALMAAVGKVNEISQDDVTGAVLTAPIEGGLSLRDVLRLLLAVNAGKTTISGSSVAFRDQADTKNRVAASMTGSQRTTIAVDPT